MQGAAKSIADGSDSPRRIRRSIVRRLLGMEARVLVRCYFSGGVVAVCCLR